MTNALKCDKCNQYTERGTSLLYKFVGFFSDERQDKKSTYFEVYDLCTTCRDIVETDLMKMLGKDKKDNKEAT